MRDELDARIWEAHHLQFSIDVDALLRRLAAAVAWRPRKVRQGAGEAR